VLPEPGASVGRGRVRAVQRRRGHAVSGDRAERQPEAQRRYRAANRDKISERERRYRHGLWPDEWQARWDAQDGRCYLCGDPLPDDPSEVRLDHDHRCHPLWPAGTPSR
jgi:hypothetical protein